MPDEAIGAYAVACWIYRVFFIVVIDTYVPYCCASQYIVYGCKLLFFWLQLFLEPGCFNLEELF